MKPIFKKGDKLFCIDGGKSLLSENKIFIFKEYYLDDPVYEDLVFLKETTTEGPWSINRFKKVGPVFQYILKGKL